MSKEATWAVLPARLASTRLPNKLLLSQTGIPLIEHTCKQVLQAKRISKVLVVTDSPEIAEACTGFGVEVLMSGPADSGTDRICQVLGQLKSKYIVNVQADEPEIDPNHIDKVAEMLTTSGVGVATLARPLSKWKDILSPSQVKVVVDSNSHALYFSRAPIPVCMEEEEVKVPSGVYLGHVGIYGYRKALLEKMIDKPTPRIVEMENLEQLKFLHYGVTVGVRKVRRAEKGIDTTVDYREFVTRKTARRRLRKAR